MLTLPVLVMQRPALLKPYLMLGGLMKTIALRLTFTYVHIYEVMGDFFFLSYGLNHRGKQASSRFGEFQIQRNTLCEQKKKNVECD